VFGGLIARYLRLNFSFLLILSIFEVKCFLMRINIILGQYQDLHLVLELLEWLILQNVLNFWEASINTSGLVYYLNTSWLVAREKGIGAFKKNPTNHTPKPPPLPYFFAYGHTQPNNEASRNYEPSNLHYNSHLKLHKNNIEISKSPPKAQRVFLTPILNSK